MYRDSLKPKLISVFEEGYSWPGLFRDLMAGLVVGIVAFPMSIAFAVALAEYSCGY